jgi:hypothetical protein
MAVATFLTQLPSFYGEDIVNARENYRYGAKTDFWGGISTLVYSQVPDFIFRWQIWLAIFQITICALGLIKLFCSNKVQSGIKFPNILVGYSALILSAQMTRDGLMFSLLIVGYAVFSESLDRSNKKKILFSIFLIAVAFSFRPWLSLSIIPIVALKIRISRVFFSRFILFIIATFLAFAPLCIEMGVGHLLSLQRSYPQQQVILMDSAASYCYTNDRLTGSKSREILRTFSSDPAFPTFACQLYRPDTWESLAQSANSSSEGFNSEFSLIHPGRDSEYENVKSKWISLIFSDPISYAQNKILFFSKILVGSDSRDFSFLSVKPLGSKFFSLYKLPYEIAILGHLYSLMSCIFIIVLFQQKKARWRDSFITHGIKLDAVSTVLIISLILWGFLSSVAYIGSNGRYTYSISILVLVIALYFNSDARSMEQK